ncbi:hypothetical protein TNCV_1640391 [Trichonephila clavipes]|nr:hypothetical protein TNCV_1640391 [Trichonephila clavipes]
MTIATLKDLIIGSENYDEELTKNIHSTIVKDRKSQRRKNLRIEEQKEKLRIEEREEKKLRFEQLRLDEQKCKYEFELEKLRTQSTIQLVIGSDLLEQASISFTKEGVKFDKYENHAQLMQISAENLQELDLRHERKSSNQKELEKLIQDYNQKNSIY